MATSPEKLADSLKALQQLQNSGIVAIRSADMTRTHRERLIKYGFISEVIKGWYIATKPDETQGESTAWYASYWQFCAAYLNHLKGEDWCLSPEQSISVHAENWTVPKQLMIRANKARNNITSLPHGTSLLDIRASLPNIKHIEIKHGLRIYNLPSALINANPQSYTQIPNEMRVVLAMVKDASDLLEELLEGGHTVIANRLIGAFKNIGRDDIANEILATMQSADYKVRVDDPFTHQPSIVFNQRTQSPYVSRMRLMWQAMRDHVIAHFPPPPKKIMSQSKYLAHIKDTYVNDAYHSLSIEGYQVTPELIHLVQSGEWQPEHNHHDRTHLDALAARGYWQAHQSVQDSVKKILAGDNAGIVASQDHRQWYREMFAPGVTAGLYQPADLAGYRHSQVYIRRSMHVPPSKAAVRDAMPTLFELLEHEDNAGVRVVLGHFIFVYIHPYMDGNGRMGRFLMNTMLASGGYPWTIIPFDQRSAYMDSLEQASTEQNIKPFTQLLASLVEA